jgi:hypothetical protein
MEDDVFTTLDFFLISLLSFLLWFLGKLRGDFCEQEEAENHHEGRKFYWRCGKEGDGVEIDIWN